MIEVRDDQQQHTDNGPGYFSAERRTLCSRISLRRTAGWAVFFTWSEFSTAVAATLKRSALGNAIACHRRDFILTHIR